MTLERVDFYLLTQSVPDGKLKFACRLAQKAYGQGYTAYVRACDPDQASRLDELLWTFDQGSFIPHCLDGDGDPAPVTIGSEPPEEDNPDVLITLGGELPVHFRVYQRVAELVDGTDEEKRLARERYKVYKQTGCQLETHQIHA